MHGTRRFCGPTDLTHIKEEAQCDVIVARGGQAAEGMGGPLAAGGFLLQEEFDG